MRKASPPNEWKIAPLAAEPVTVAAGLPADGMYLANPAIEVMPGGRIVVAVDQFGPGVKKLPGKKGKHPRLNRWLQGRVFVSNDHGKTWAQTQTYPFSGARLFRDSHALYLLGDAGSLQIARSPDGGTTWSEPEDLTARTDGGDTFSLGPANVIQAGHSIYLAATRLTDPGFRGDPAAVTGLVIARAASTSNLLNAKNWSFSAPAVFRDFVDEAALDHAGIPYYRLTRPNQDEPVANRRWAGHIGWTSAHLVQVRDPNHAWHDPAGHTFHAVCSAHTHRSDIAALARFTEDASGALTPSLETAPSGRKIAFLHLPGGHLRFDLLYDEESKLYWLVSNQSRTSLVRPDRLPPEIIGLPGDDRRRLQLHFSPNLVDWCFAGLIDAAADPRDTRRDPGMAIRGRDLSVVCQAGETHLQDPDKGNRVLFYSIPNFRDLAY